MQNSTKSRKSDMSGRSADIKISTLPLVLLNQFRQQYGELNQMQLYVWARQDVPGKTSR